MYMATMILLVQECKPPQREGANAPPGLMDARISPRSGPHLPRGPASGPFTGRGRPGRAPFSFSASEAVVEVHRPHRRPQAVHHERLGVEVGGQPLVLGAPCEPRDLPVGPGAADQDARVHAAARKPQAKILVLGHGRSQLVSAADLPLPEHGCRGMPTILMADDDRDMHQIGAAIFEHAGFRVLHVYRGADLPVLILTADVQPAPRFRRCRSALRDGSPNCAHRAISWQRFGS